MDAKAYADPKADKEWPGWRYGPKGESAQFEAATDVPEGWKNHPSEFDSSVGKMAQTNEAGEAIDGFGATWNADINAADKSLTKGGLWKLQPGKTRPAPAEGYPKADFDL